MSLLNGFRRRLIVWLGGVADKPATAPGPLVRTADAPIADGESTSDGGPIFDPSQPADAPFVDLPSIDGVGDSDPYPNDRRLKRRRSARTGTRVLLVDDSPTIVALLRKLLQQNGYETLEAGDAETGIQLARETQPDIIFLDIVLPGMNGFAALRALRRDPLTKAIPIIMISGNVAATEQFYVQRIGADDFMKKPFSRTEVFSRIEVLLDAAHVPRRAAERDPTPEPLPAPQATPPI
jgi:CheY-like chemotaxis protein